MPYTIVTRRVTVHRKALPTFKRGCLPAAPRPLAGYVFIVGPGLDCRIHPVDRPCSIHAAAAAGLLVPRLQNDYVRRSTRPLAGGRRPCLAGHNGCAFLAPVPDNDVGCGGGRGRATGDLREGRRRRRRCRLRCRLSGAGGRRPLCCSGLGGMAWPHLRHNLFVGGRRSKTSQERPLQCVTTAVVE